MPTPFEDLNTAVKAMMALVNAAASHNVVQAIENFGTDFQVTSGHSVYQIHISPREDFSRGSVIYPRAEVTIFIHHYASGLVAQELFQFVTMSHVADELLDVTKWQAQSGVFSLDPDEDPEISDGSIEGRVITFEVTATVLMDPV